MRRVLRGALVTALALSVLAAVGCGSSSTDQANKYVDALNKAQTDFVAAMSKVQSSSSGVAGVSETLKNMKAALTKVVADMKAVTPPDKVKALHNQLIGEMSQVGSEVDKMSAATATGDVKKIVAAEPKFVNNVSGLSTKVGNTIDAINAKLHS
jgi:hypothetical protein